MPNEELEKQVEQYEQDLNSGKKKSKKSVIKYILNISIVLIATFTAVFLSVYKNFDEIIKNLQACDYRWILLVIGLMFVCFFVRSLVYACFARLYTTKYSVIQGVVIDQVGIFYNAVTPGASGGQIMQAYTFKKQGIPISSAVSIMAMWSIVYQGVLIIYGLVSFIFKYDFINAIGDIPFNIGGWSFSIPIWPLTIIGFVLNLSVILIVLLMGYWKGFHNFVMGPCITFFSKIRIIKKPDETRENLRTQVENFKIELKRLLTNIPFMILVAFLFFVAMTIRFSVPYFIGLALGNQSTVDSFWDSVFLCNYHQMVTGLIPIPGAAGVSEYFFSKLFLNEALPQNGFFYSPGVDDVVTAQVASHSMCMAALLLWRTITFTLPLVVAGFVSAFYRTNGKPKNLKLEDIQYPERQTLVDLQRETYLDRKLSSDSLVETSKLTREAILNKVKKKKKPASKKSYTKETIDSIDIHDGDDSI